MYRGPAQVMPTAHRHQELELNLIFKGAISYLYKGQTLELSAGQSALFWATTPHRLIDCAPDTNLGWITIPFSNFLSYTLPDQLVKSILRGRLLSSSFKTLDGMLFDRWMEDQMITLSENTSILELELQAWLYRMALNLKDLPDHKQLGLSSKAARLAQYISEHYQEPLHLSSMAEVVSLNPSYAATLFKKTFGMTLNDYLTQHRIAHAQRLLITTDKSILELAFESGFGSSSQFYSAFVKACSQTPRAFREAVKYETLQQI